MTETPFHTVGGSFNFQADPQAQAVQGFGVGVGEQHPPQAPQQFFAPQASQQFVPQPQAPAQQFGQQNPYGVQPGYAQSYAPQAPAQFGPQNPYGVQPGYAPQAPAQPMPSPVFVHPEALTPTRDNNAVGQSSAGDNRPLREDLGWPCFFRLKRVFTRPNPNQNGAPQEVAVADRIVINTADPSQSRVFHDTWIFNGPVVRDFKETIDRNFGFHEGRPVEKPTRGGKPAIVLQPLTQEEHDLALLLGEKLGWFKLS